PDLEEIKVRAPITTYPRDLFAPIREGRSVTIDNIPDPTTEHLNVVNKIYSIFHSFDVTSLSRIILYTPRKSRLSNWYVTLYMATREQAELACRLYDG
ncbi:hypothetical protein P153DRAFT_258332, partial [Dothidotthia symphoricarpi CBS 119687]